MGVRFTEKQLQELVARGRLRPEQLPEPVGSISKERSTAKSPAGGTRRGTPGQDRVWQMLRNLYRGEVERDFRGAVPGRRFEVDIAFPRYRLGLEVDGWANHGQTKRSFERDREKDRLLKEHDWLVLRFTNRECVRETGMVLDTVARFLERRRHLPANPSGD